MGARILAVELGRFLGQQLVVDNRAGASGSIGTDMIAKAPPDGYTIGPGNIQCCRRLKFDQFRQVVPICD